ncbi:MAG TPA: bile acid:sodium symporter [Polyangia bacterium]
MSGDVLVRAGAAVYLATMMFSIGILVGAAPKAEPQARRRDRRLLLRALAIDLFVLPAAAWSILRLLGAHGYVATGLLILAAAPGSRILPSLARRAHGELTLSVEIALWLAKLTAFTAPTTLALLIDVHRVRLHDLRIIAALLGIQLLPYLAGRALRRRRPRWAARLGRPLDLARTVLFVALVALIVATGKLAGLRIIGEIGWIGVLVFSAFSLALGYVCGGARPSVRRSFALAVNARDLSLSLALATLAFPGRPVELPLFAAWLITFACNVMFAELAGRRARSASGEAFAYQR